MGDREKQVEKLISVQTAIFNFFDKDKSGLIDFGEFIDYLVLKPFNFFLSRDTSVMIARGWFKSGGLVGYDKDGDGKLNLEEFLVCICKSFDFADANYRKEYLGKSDEDFENLYNTNLQEASFVGFDLTGVVEKVSEAKIAERRALIESSLKAQFELYDSSKDGFVTEEEYTEQQYQKKFVDLADRGTFEQVTDLAKSCAVTRAEKIVASADKNDDKKISFEEFKEFHYKLYFAGWEFVSDKFFNESQVKDNIDFEYPAKFKALQEAEKVRQEEEKKRLAKEKKDKERCVIS